MLSLITDSGTAERLSEHELSLLIAYRRMKGSKQRMLLDLVKHMAAEDSTAKKPALSLVGGEA